MRWPVLSAGLMAGILALTVPAVAQPPTASEPPIIPIPRTAFLMETLRTGDLPANVVAKLGPVKTLLEAEALLKSANLPFTWAKTTANVAQLGPQLTLTLAKLPPGEVFVIPRPGGGGVLIGVILGQN